MSSMRLPILTWCATFWTSNSACETCLLLSRLQNNSWQLRRERPPRDLRANEAIYPLHEYFYNGLLSRAGLIPISDCLVSRIDLASPYFLREWYNKFLSLLRNNLRNEIYFLESKQHYSSPPPLPIYKGCCRRSATLIASINAFSQRFPIKGAKEKSSGIPRVVLMAGSKYCSGRGCSPVKGALYFPSEL